MGTWLPWAIRIDLSSRMGNGPFRPGRFLGTIHHVNAGRTLPAFYIGGGGPASVCPTFQVDFDGTTWQLQPLENSPWCQSDGNASYGAIETAGQPTDPLTPQQQLAHARILAAYAQVLRMPLQLAQVPGDRGYGWHGMGGAAWGGHYGCPGDVRRAQMPGILLAATRGATVTDPAPDDATVQPREDRSMKETLYYGAVPHARGQYELGPDDKQLRLRAIDGPTAVTVVTATGTRLFPNAEQAGGWDMVEVGPGGVHVAVDAVKHGAVIVDVHGCDTPRFVGKHHDVGVYVGP